MKTASTEAPAVRVRRAAMDLLARREHSFFELQQKLSEKFPELSLSEVLLPALERLRSEQLQSDARFTANYVRYRAARGFGPLKIAAELQPRRIDRDLLRESLYGSLDWEALCAEALRRKFRVEGPSTAAEQARWQRFLQQRGFEGEQIRAVLRALRAGEVTRG